MDLTGVSRPVDKMGRVVIPKEIRDQLNIVSDVDKIDITVEGDKIILRKHRSACFFCGKLAGGVKYKDYVICHECVDALKQIKDENGIIE